MDHLEPDWRIGVLLAAGLLNLAMAATLASVGRPPERRLAAALVILTGILAPYALIVGGIEAPPPGTAGRRSASRSPWAPCCGAIFAP